MRLRFKPKKTKQKRTICNFGCSTLLHHTKSSYLVQLVVLSHSHSVHIIKIICFSHPAKRNCNTLKPSRGDECCTKFKVIKNNFVAQLASIWIDFFVMLFSQKFHHWYSQYTCIKPYQTYRHERVPEHIWTFK